LRSSGSNEGGFNLSLLEKTQNCTINVGVIGLGYVGAAIAGAFAKGGFNVIGCDINEQLVSRFNSGNISLAENDLGNVINNAVRSGKLLVTSVPSLVVDSCDAIIVSVQTPISKTHKPDLSYLLSAFREIGKTIKSEKIFIIESTIPPGTTKKICSLVEQLSGLKGGKNLWFAHCPERLSPGASLRDFELNDKIIGGVDENSTLIASALYSQVIKGKIIKTDCLSAELAKLSENTFRAVNIAFANELSLICKDRGADVMEVIKIANTHPRVNIHNPGCGVGGPCLPKDPYLLLWGLKRTKPKSMIKCSVQLNSFMEDHTLSIVFCALRDSQKAVKNSKISILGVTYKKETDDTRYAPSKRIISKLMKLGATIHVYDPLSRETFGGTPFSDPYSAIANTDCLVILTDHMEFSKLDLSKIKKIMSPPASVVDGRRILSSTIAKGVGIHYYGIGEGSKS
jgi:UDP-N-acetyl-D-mannosaminuronic acid dehydrogenase